MINLFAWKNEQNWMKIFDFSYYFENIDCNSFIILIFWTKKHHFSYYNLKITLFPLKMNHSEIYGFQAIWRSIFVLAMKSYQIQTFKPQRSSNQYLSNFLHRWSFLETIPHFNYDHAALMIFIRYWSLFVDFYQNSVDFVTLSDELLNLHVSRSL